MPLKVIYPSLRLKHTSREPPSVGQITTITRLLTQVLCQKHIEVRDMRPTRDGYKLLMNTNKDLDAVIGIGEDLLKQAQLRIEIPPEIRAKMTLVIRPVNPQLLDREFVKKALTDRYPWADIIDVWTGDRNRVLKITLRSPTQAERLKSGGILMPPYSFRSFDIEYDEYYHLPECTWCYRLKAHATSKCPHRTEILCSICGCDGHRFHACPNHDAVPRCINCARAGEAKCDHRTRSNTCPARKRLVQELRSKAEVRPTFPPAPENMSRLFSRVGGVAGGEHAPEGAAPNGQTTTSPNVWSSTDGPMPEAQARMLGCLWVAVFRDAYEPGMFGHILGTLFEDNSLPRLNIREGILDGKRLLAALNLGAREPLPPEAVLEDLTGRTTQHDSNGSDVPDVHELPTHPDPTRQTKTKPKKKKKPKTKTDAQTKDPAPPPPQPPHTPNPPPETRPPHTPNPSLEKSTPPGSAQAAPSHVESVLESSQVAPTHEEPALATPKPKKPKTKTKSKSNLFQEPPSPPTPEIPPIPIPPTLLALPPSSFPPPRTGRDSPMSDPGSLSDVSSVSVDSSLADESLPPLHISPTVPSSPSLPPSLPSQPFPDTPCRDHLSFVVINPHLSSTVSLPSSLDLPPLVEVSPPSPIPGTLPLSSSSDVTVISTPSSTIPQSANAAPRRTYCRFSPVGTRSRSLSYSGRTPSSQRRELSPSPTESTSSPHKVQ